MERSGKNASVALMLLIALLTLSGCAGGPAERALIDLSEVAIQEPAPAPEEDAWADRTLLATLYFLDASGERLVPVTREVTATGGEHAARAALNALLAGTIEGENAYWPELGDVAADAWAEFSGETATVSIPARARALTPQMLYAVRMAIAGTLTEFSGINYVNVLVDGREEGLDLGATRPVGTLSRVQDMDVGAQYRRLIAQGEEARASTLLTALFFPAAGGEYVLSTVRSVAYTSSSPVDCLYTLLLELGRSPGDTLLAQDVPAPMDYIVEMPEIVRIGEGAYRGIELSFRAELDEALAKAGLTRGVYFAMLADTLLGFVPGVDALLLSVGGEQIVQLTEEQTPDGIAVTFEQGMARRQDFVRYTGSPVTLYAPDGKTGLLAPAARALAQERQHDPRARLEGLISLEEAAELWSGLSQTDILAVQVDGDRALVNLSQAFADRLRALDAQQERAAVYAMVNTLTQDGELRSVAFYFAGRQVERLAGALEMRGSFLRDPGMVVN